MLTVARGISWWVTSVMGDNAYARYVQHLALHHPGEPPPTEREYWRQQVRRAGRATRGALLLTDPGRRSLTVELAHSPPGSGLPNPALPRLPFTRTRVGLDVRGSVQDHRLAAGQRCSGARAADRAHHDCSPRAKAAIAWCRPLTAGCPG